MSDDEVKIQPWSGSERPTEAAIRRLLDEEGWQPYGWSNGSGDVYGAHDHAYHKVIYVVRGSITFGMPKAGRRITLKAGDRLDLPAGVLHDAVVGPDGVTCLEAYHVR